MRHCFFRYTAISCALAAGLLLAHSSARGAALAQSYDARSAPASQLTVSHDFEIVNTSRATLVLDRIITSCRCTSASPVDGLGALPVTLRPGQHKRIRVTVALVGQAPGALAKDVYLYRRGQSTPAFTLEIDATVAASSQVLTPSSTHNQP